MSALCSTWRHFLSAVISACDLQASLPTQPCSVLVRRASDGSKPWAIAVDTADFHSAECHFALSRHQCLCEGSAMAAGIGSLALVQQTRTLPGVVPYSAESVLV